MLARLALNFTIPFSKPFGFCSFKFSGGFVERVTPVPIPNTEVKPAGADGTARVTVWESRKSPELNFEKARLSISGLFHFL